MPRACSPRLPASLKEMAYDPFGARVIVYALLLDTESELIRTDQRRRLAACGSRRVPASRSDLSRYPPTPGGVAPAAGLDGRPGDPTALGRPVHPVCLLRGLARPCRQPGEPLRVLRSAGSSSAARRARPGHVGRYTTPRPRWPNRARQVLGTLAHVGNPDAEAAAQAYAAGVRSLGWPHVEASLPAGDLDLDSFDGALDQLAAAAPDLKRQILAACASCIGVDGRITIEEGELLHAIAGSLGCPLPPLRSLPGADRVGAGVTA